MGAQSGAPARADGACDDVTARGHRVCARGDALSMCVRACVGGMAWRGVTQRRHARLGCAHIVSPHALRFFTCKNDNAPSILSNTWRTPCVSIMTNLPFSTSTAVCCTVLSFFL